MACGIAYLNDHFQNFWVGEAGGKGARARQQGRLVSARYEPAGLPCPRLLASAQPFSFAEWTRWRCRPRLPDVLWRPTENPSPPTAPAGLPVSLFHEAELCGACVRVWCVDTVCNDALGEALGRLSVARSGCSSRLPAGGADEFVPTCK